MDEKKNKVYLFRFRFMMQKGKPPNDSCTYKVYFLILQVNTKLIQETTLEIDLTLLILRGTRQTQNNFKKKKTVNSPGNESNDGVGEDAILF